MSRVPRLLPLVAIAIGGVVAVRAVGAGPELFQGARAWAEEAAPAAAAASGEGGGAQRPAPPAVCAVDAEELARQAGLSPAELRVLQSLSARRGELDARDADFETRLPLLIAAEAKVDDKIAALTALRGEIEALIGQVDAREQAEIDRLVQVYSAMRPREAAAVFAVLEDEVRLPVAAAMRPRSLAAIMAQMPPAAARQLTERLASRFQAQQLAARADAAVADRPAQPAAREAAAAPAAPPAAREAAARPAAPTPRPAASTPRPAARTPAPAATTPAATTPAPPPAQPAADEPPAEPRVSVQ